MASELRVNTLKDASGNNSVATSTVAGGSAKAWCHLNGTATFDSSDTEIYDSLNISSTTDENTGRPTVNINNDMLNTNYGVTTGGSDSLSDFIGRVAAPATTKTAGSYGIKTINNAGSAFLDYEYLMTVVNGDLA